MSLLKKIFFLSLFILGVSLLFWGVYNLSFKSNTPTTTAVDNAPTKKTNSDIKAGTEKISPASQTAVIAPTLSPDGNSLDYFSAQSGQLLQADFYGETQKTLSQQKISGLSDAFWSVDKLKVILETHATNNTSSFSFYDTATGTITPLKKNLDQVVWQTNANRILYKYYDATTKTRTLNVSDPDGSNWTKIADLPYQNVSIAQIPRTGLVSFWNSGDAYIQTNLQTVPLIGGATKTLSTNGFGADYLWDAAGDRTLVSHTNSKGGFQMGLGIMNANGGEYRNLDIPTFITKCVWSKDGRTVFYALPGDIPNNSILPNDYNAGKFQTTDTFWKVDTQTGEKTRLVEISDINGQYDASQMFLNQSESLLFFVNKIDGKLYKIAL